MELLVAIVILNIDCAFLIMYGANHAWVEIFSCSHNKQELIETAREGNERSYLGTYQYQLCPLTSFCAMILADDGGTYVKNRLRKVVQSNEFKHTKTPMHLHNMIIIPLKLQM